MARKEGRRKTERKRNFDLFIGSANQLKTHWTALTLISFCSTSSWVLLLSSHLSGIALNLAKQKFPPSHTGIKQGKSHFQTVGIDGGGWGIAAAPTAFH